MRVTVVVVVLVLVIPVPRVTPIATASSFKWGVSK
jgi:hypothetical protein